MLKSAYDDSRRYFLVLGEPADVHATIRTSLDKSLPVRQGYQELRSPVVGLGLKVIIHAVGFINEHVLFAVQEDVRGFVKQTEPQVVSCFVPSTQGDNWLAWRQPPGGTAQARFFQRLDK